MTQPCSRQYQFVGYWGYGNQKELQNSIARILSAAPNTKVTARRSDTSANYGIGYIGLNAAVTEEGLIASVSASGIANSPDSWVKVQGDRLILFREPFGRVPLYWTQVKQVIWFASQLQLLLPIIETPQVSIPGLYGYSCFSYVPTPLTPVEHIFAVPAGTELIWQQTASTTLNCTSHQWHQWQEATELIQDQEEATQQLQTLLKDSIQRQLADLPDEPVGVFLSGGLDSSIVAALLVQAGVKVQAYTLDFGEYGIPELPYAAQVAQFLNIPLRRVSATPSQIRGAIAATTQALDLPFGDGVTVPLYLLCQAASQETSVVFNGEGGDQLFAGWTNKPLIAASVYNTQHSDLSAAFTQNYLRTFHRLWGYEAEVFQLDVYAQVRSLNPQQWLQDALDSTFCDSLLHRLRRANLMLKGAQNIQPRATNLAFAHGLFVRSPFCDLPLAEWTFQLSGELCLRGACEKYLLKRVVESWLPPEIVWREKRGMGVPLTNWCLNQLWSNVITWLNPGILKAEKRWQSQLPLQVIKGELGGQIRDRRIGEILWLLMIWQVWRTQVLGERVEGTSFDYHLWLFRQMRRFKGW